ncbi:MAG TPA: hypothetical protein VK448_05210 [Dissulfurispiraceae bacterium]|nr:hypothetical protein [Dissulfurispiraceae bacterium]
MTQLRLALWSLGFSDIVVVAILAHVARNPGLAKVSFARLDKGTDYDIGCNKRICAVAACGCRNSFLHDFDLHGDPGRVGGADDGLAGHAGRYPERHL